MTPNFIMLPQIRILNHMPDSHETQHKHYAIQDLRNAISRGNDIQSIARQQPMTTREGFLEAVFSVGYAPRLYNEDTTRPAVSFQQFSWVKWREVVGWWVGVQLAVWSQYVKRRLGGWREMAASLGPSQLTRILHGRLWQEDLSVGSWRISLGRSRCQETASGDCIRLRTLVCACQ
jgi:hypothetical protein